MTEPVIIQIRGELPSKKNDRQIRRWGNRVGIGNSAEKEALMGALAWQVRAQWGSRKPLQHPRISFQLQVKHRRKDRDNLVTTILDVLVNTGVLVNDNIAHANGELTILPAIVDPKAEEGCEVTLWA